MAFREVCLCVTAVLIQFLGAQCFPGPMGADLPYPGCGCGLGAPFPPSCNGPAIAPTSPLPANLPPPGMSIYSDNLVIEGPVVVAGRMPFTGTVAVEGAFPTAGAGAVTYGCGEGGVGIVSEMPVAPVGSPFEYGVIDGYAFNSLTAPNIGCGPRMIY